jgi:hypothetical protein
MGLDPSFNTSSWLEQQKGKIEKTLSALTDVAKEFSSLASNVISAVNSLTNFIDTGDKNKHWFFYKYLDNEKNKFAVEWHIDKNLIEQFGPMLQGSIVINFHGTPAPDFKMNLVIKPSIHFDKQETDDLDYINPFKNVNIEILVR